MHAVSKLLLLHAKDDDLKFLNPVHNRLSKILVKNCDTFELGDQHSHAAALLALKKAQDVFVTIFTHGANDYLRGGEYQSRRTGEIMVIEKFITKSDLSFLKGKSVFCLSCASNGLAEASLQAGALSFVGFDEVPFNRFDASGNPIGSHVLVKHSQQLIAVAVQVTLERFVTGSVSLRECVDFLRLWIAQNAVTYIRSNPSVKERRDIAALFLRVGAGVKYHGNPNIFFHSNG